jgi:hypothetical protein
MRHVRRPIKDPRYVIIDEAHDLLYRRKVRLGSRRAREEPCFDICENGGYSLYGTSPMPLK